MTRRREYLPYDHPDVLDHLEATEEERRDWLTIHTDPGHFPGMEHSGRHTHAMNVHLSAVEAAGVQRYLAAKRSPR